VTDERFAALANKGLRDRGAIADVKLHAVQCCSDAGFSNAEVSPNFSPRNAARTMRRITFAFRVFGMLPTKITSRGASALPSWVANAFSKL
jgi:hypothetical protein